jgi:Co/Zn/Cd efflux system component
VGLAVNLGSAWLLGEDQAHDHHHDHDHQQHEHHADHNIRAAYVHVLADALTSVLAIIALVAGRFWHLRGEGRRRGSRLLSYP